MCVATIANCFAPHTSCSLRKITRARLCDAQQCASSHVTFGILNMLVVVRSAPYLYLRIEGDPWIELYRLRYHIYICQIIARYEVHNQLQFLAYVSTFPLFYTKYHFEADRHSDRDKPNIGHVISGTIVLCTVVADSDLPDTIAIGNHHVPKLYGLPLLMPLWNKDYVVLECGVIAALEHRTLWCSGVHYLPTSLYNCQSI